MGRGPGIRNARSGLIACAAVFGMCGSAHGETAIDVAVAPSTDDSDTAVFQVTDPPDYEVRALSEQCDKHKRKHRIRDLWADPTFDGWVEWGRGTMSPSGMTAVILGSPLAAHVNDDADQLFFYAKLRGRFLPLGWRPGRPLEVEEEDLVFNIHTDKVAIDVTDAAASYHALLDEVTISVEGIARPAPGTASFQEVYSGVADSMPCFEIFLLDKTAEPENEDFEPDALEEAWIAVMFDPVDARYHTGQVDVYKEW